MTEDATSVVRFWLGEAERDPPAARQRHAFWYRTDAQVDASIRSRFGHLIDAALAGRLESWQSTAEGSLALVILLDQFTRNVFRATPQAYAGDRLAWRYAQEAVSADQQRQLSVVGTVFLLHPYHHSEVLAHQEQGLSALEDLRRIADQAWESYVDDSLEGFRKHRDIIARFGRFPHRNRLFNRPNTPEEATFLAGGAQTYGQG